MNNTHKIIKFQQEKNSLKKCENFMQKNKSKAFSLEYKKSIRIPSLGIYNAT
jgi:hypothetical protein